MPAETAPYALDAMYYVRVIAAFTLVVVAMLACAWAARKLQGRVAQVVSKKSDPRTRLSVENSVYVDAKTRLLLVRRGDVGHVLCLQTGQAPVVVEQGIALSPQAQHHYAGEEDHAA